MYALLAVAMVSAALQQTPAAPLAEDSSQQLLQAAVAHMNAQRLDSASIVLRRVAEGPTRDAVNRVRAWVMLGVVDYYRSGDSASAFALRQALALDPNLQTPALERNYPHVARILAAERAAVAPPAVALAPPPPTSPAEPPPPPSTPAADQGSLYDCTAQCPVGVMAPYFRSFPDLGFVDAGSGGAGGGIGDRRMRSYAIFQGVVNADGWMEPETLVMEGGTARGMEGDLRRGLAQARFIPGRAEGMPVRTKVRVRFDFTAEGTGSLRYTYRVTAPR